MVKKEKEGIIYYEFEHFNQTGLVNHCFSTRIGGVSKAPYASMNLAYHMGDVASDVDTNFKRISEAVGFDAALIVMSNQVHDAKLHVVENQTVVPAGIDGLITQVPGYALTTYYADCVPLLFLDPVKKVIANAHSGWCGTVAGIGCDMVDKLVHDFGCDPVDLLVGIGPSISLTHFEVGREVVEVFEKRFSWSTGYLQQTSHEKWHIDLIGINRALLLRCGVKAAHIDCSDLCTYECPDLFFSHRRDGTARGNMAAMIALKSEMS
ncbi:MAG: peptidoglycan editing factor PgeF [Defluviitaleaceae bacterium]|nr:peptidoglycan editing factor PgeF [Defluviitaleaceae bacterium]